MPKGKIRLVRMTVLVPLETRRFYQGEARREGMKLSQWLRRFLHFNAMKTTGEKDNAAT